MTRKFLNPESLLEIPATLQMVRQSLWGVWQFIKGLHVGDALSAVSDTDEVLIQSGNESKRSTVDTLFSDRDLTNPKIGGVATVAFEASDASKLDGIASSAEVNPDLIPEAEAEAGTATTERLISAERLSQSIESLGGPLIETFTPTYATTGTDFDSVTYDYQNGLSIKLGRLVIVGVSMRTDAITVGSGSGFVRVGGLLYTVSSTTSEQIFNKTATRRAFTDDTNFAAVRGEGGTTRLMMLDETGFNIPSITHLGTGANANQLTFTGMYLTT